MPVTHNGTIEEIIRIAQDAGKIAMAFYDKKYAVKEKANRTPVTEADMAVHHFLMDALAVYNYPIVSEEGMCDCGDAKSAFLWIVDPLDGTQDFLQKTGDFSILIGLIYKGEPILGVVYEPVKETTYWAEKNGGAFMKKGGKIQKLHVSNKKDFSDMTILLSRNHCLESDKVLYETLGIGKQKKRGSTSKMCVIARGDAEVYVNTSNRTSEWDTCAVHMILQEAGGKITDMNGNSLIYGKKQPLNINGFVATNGVWHNEFVRVVSNL